MATQRRYPSLTSDSSISPFKILFTLLILAFLGFFTWGSFQIVKELRTISEGQQMLILKMAANVNPEPVLESTNSQTDGKDMVSKVDFIKFRNETRKQIHDLAKDLRLVQTKLRLKRTVLDNY